MQKKDFCRIFDFSTEEIGEVFLLARKLKQEVPEKSFSRHLQNHVLAMIFEKPSLRTRCTFEIAMLQMGGNAIYLSPNEIGLGQRETTHDVAKNLERWFDMVMARTFLQSTVDELAHHAAVPVINALSDEEHPCQAMADFLTLLEKRNTFDGLKLAFLGDGNNICHSLMFLAARLGVDFRMAGPEGYLPAPEMVEKARRAAEETGAKILITTSAEEAVEGASAVYTDVWASMGQEEEARERETHFRPYQLNAELMNGAEKNAWVMHDLPAHRGEEITDERMDCPQSIVFDQAENRLHAQKAIMVYLNSLHAKI